MSKVFISYRREDAAPYAQAIYTHLEERLRRDQIFMDVDTIEAGADFISRIERAVSDSELVIALIGKRWMGEPVNGRPRIHDPRDFVHLEIATALAWDIKVIPVLVDGASLPRANELPRSLQPLLRRNALEWSITRYRYDLERISRAAESAVGAATEKKRFRRDRQLWYGGLSLILIALAIAASLWFKDGEEGQSVTEKVNSPPARQSSPLENEQLIGKARPAEKKEQETQVKALLYRAKIAEDKVRLTTPAEDNAAGHYREVLRLDPGNPDAQRGLDRIVERYIGWVERELSRYQFDKAAGYLEKAETVTPDHPDLAMLRTRFEKLKGGFRDSLKIGGAGPEMVVVPGGTFQMGDVQGDGANTEQPVRAVHIPKHFAIGRYEVTFAEYDQFAKATGRQLPSDEDWGRNRNPVINVLWKDAKAYAGWLSEQTGESYRLPTEAEWEYAARSGSSTHYWWGNTRRGTNLTVMANCENCGSRWDNQGIAPVGSFAPNKFGLYDTAGNVWEWVEDCWHASYEGAPTDGSVWLEAGGGECDKRIRRGGSWDEEAVHMRSARRGWYYSEGSIALTLSDNEIGFRLARDLP